MAADLLPVRVHLQQTSQETTFLDQTLEPRETALDVPHTERPGGQVETGIARRNETARQPGLLLLERPPGQLDLTDSGVQQSQSERLAHARRRRNPAQRGYRLVVSLRVGIGVTERLDGGDEVGIQLQRVAGLLDRCVYVATLARISATYAWMCSESGSASAARLADSTASTRRPIAVRHQAYW